MKIQDQIKAIKELIEATKELNGEYQDGWEDVIEQGEQVLNHLNSQSIKNPQEELSKSTMRVERMFAAVHSALHDEIKAIEESGELIYSVEVQKSLTMMFNHVVDNDIERVFKSK